jgi:hypothetical protein
MENDPLTLESVMAAEAEAATENRCRGPKSRSVTAIRHRKHSPTAIGNVDRVLRAEEPQGIQIRWNDAANFDSQMCRGKRESQPVVHRFADCGATGGLAATATLDSEYGG